MKFSVVVASRNEGPQIVSGLKRLRAISQTSPIELIVVDGGSDDGTAEAAGDWADSVIAQDAPNRGAQWDAGAKKATGDLLFFLRADAQPPVNWQQALEHFWLTKPDERIAAVAFSVDYGAGFGLRALSAWSNSRVRRGIVGADHGLCTTPDVYAAAGGYPPFAELEDYEFSRRLSARGRIARLPELTHAAARRMRSQGPFSYLSRRLWVESRYRFGATPESLFAAAPGR